MANLPEESNYEEGIYQLEETDPVMGGPDGIDNLQAKQLANRTLWLKQEVEALQAELNSIDAYTKAEVDALTNDKLTQANADALYVQLANQRNRNYLINGNFDIWQRGISTTFNGYGSNDRWLDEDGGSTKVHTRESFDVGQTEVPNNPSYFSRTVVASSSGNGNHVIKSQKIEDVRNLAGETVTLSFWAKADGNKKLATSFQQDFGTGGSSSVSGIAPTIHQLTNTWQKFTVTTDMPSISGKTIGSQNNSSLWVRFWFDAGSNFDFRTNSLGHQSGTFDIAQVQLEKGSLATNFETKSIAEELSLCQRYFRKSYISKVFPGTADNSAKITYVASSGGGAQKTVEYPTMRTSPSVIIYSPATGSANRLRNQTLGQEDLSIDASFVGESNFVVNKPSGHVTGHTYAFHYSADAEL